MSITIGVDVGSITTKIVMLQDGRRQTIIQPSGPSPRQAAEGALEQLLARAGVELDQVNRIIATGYGRGQAAFAHQAITEITCHARGAQELVPGADMVIDIGGQDSKVIRTDGAGRVLDFAMNDKCAAGTGRFLEVMAGALGVELDGLAELAQGAQPVEITSMCTVFAESEVISLLAQDVPPAQVAAGIHRSAARRVAAMAERLGVGRLVCFTGGVAKNQGVVQMLSSILDRDIQVSPDCQLAGALGAALLAAESAAGH